MSKTCIEPVTNDQIDTTNVRDTCQLLGHTTQISAIKLLLSIVLGALINLTYHVIAGVEFAENVLPRSLVVVVVSVF